MPVLITGAEQPAAHLLAASLRASGGEVRVFCDLERPDHADPQRYRALGCKVAQGTLDDEAHLEAACEQVHTVVHLAVDPLRADAAVEHAAAVVSAAVGAGVRRVVVASDLVLDLPEPPPGVEAWVTALTEVEELFGDVPGEVLIIRRALTWAVDDPLLRAALAAGAATSGGVLGTHHALAAVDLARTVARWDVERTAVADGSALLRLHGPAPVSADVLVAVADEAPAPPLSAVARALLAATVPPPSGSVAAGTPPP